MNNLDKVNELKLFLKESDSYLIRIIEDLIRILVQRGVLKYSDFCDESRIILNEREKIRTRLREILANDSKVDGEN